ncbi:MAG: methylated-DNA--[protein]-cysteine S-methyltransferase [Gammaproteobacteria bacterium]|nr:methylated-DNA--[protein]-cysteine S-methyltransferase [Gammaproteobacteria bacterium]MCD8542342.1 methylated-DNA--[protein]-cysteine S-methyltransferase [Gammaproteobacteria bacterium]
MLVIADDKQLYLLEFIERRGLEKEIKKLRDRLSAAIVPGKTKPIEFIEKELKAYFEGKLTQFKTPFILIGSDFQKSVWSVLCDIPYGTTKSYAEQADMINKPTAYRAVANANGMNQLAIIVPCHRVIRSQGELGGYGAGVARKQWLLEHEKKYDE